MLAIPPEIGAVALGGACGATLRYLTGIGVAHAFATSNPLYPFPLSTFLVNALGCLMMGFLSVVFSDTSSPSTALWKTFATTGVLGGFTTMSTFSLETIGLFESGAAGTGTANLALTLVTCLGFILLGRMIAHALLPAR